VKLSFVTLAALAALAACGGGAGPRTASIAVAPGEGPRSAAEAGAVEPQKATALQIVPTDLSDLCGRIGGRVHCVGRDAPWAHLASAPPVPDLEGAIDFSVSSLLGCAVMAGGGVRCWGGNYHGELGAGLREDHHPGAVAAVGVEGAVKVVTSRYHACALLRDGSVRCWGSNMAGETGGTMRYLEQVRELVLPIQVPGLEEATDIAVVDGKSCALTRGKTRGTETLCWGAPAFAGFRDDARSETPARVDALTGLESLVGDSGSFCGLRRGAVVCWGYLPFEDVNGVASPPREILMPGPANSVALGDRHGCALLGDGRVACWGHNDKGAVGARVDGGDESMTSAEPARIVAGLPRATAIFVGGAASCALTRAEGLVCWGATASGTPGSAAPFPVTLD